MVINRAQVNLQTRLKLLITLIFLQKQKTHIFLQKQFLLQKHVYVTQAIAN